LVAVVFGTILANSQESRHELLDSSSPDLTLSQILDYIEANLLVYQQSVPNIYCTELAHASRKSGGQLVGPDLASPGGNLPSERVRAIEDKASVSSVFRLRRSTEVGQVGVFDESRVVQSVNGKAPASQNLAIPVPAVLYGVFSNGLYIFSREGRSCFAFKLHSAKKQQFIDIEFKDLPQNERSADCPSFAKTSGHVVIERKSMHVIRINKRIPRTELIPGVFGSWEWSEDYAPIALNTETLWMPSRIVSTSVAEDGVSHNWLG
jgi:hypothetical protein